MAYGTVKVDNITFDNGGSDQNVTVSGLYRATTSGVTVTGTISGAVLVGTTTVSGATVTGNVVQGTTVQGISGTFTSLTGTTTTGTTANFASGVFTTRVSGTIITGDTGQFTSGTFVSLTGTTITGTTINAVTVSSTTGTFTSLTGTTITGTTINGVTVSATTGSFTSLTGTTTSGTTANFVSGVFTTQVSGTTVTGTTSNFTSGNFATLSGATATFTSGVIALGTATNPSLSFVGDPNTGIYSTGADQLAVATNGTGRLFIDASGRLLVGTSTSYNAPSIIGTQTASSNQIHSAVAGSGSQLIAEWSTSTATGGSSLKLAKSNSGTVGTHTALSVNQDIGSLVFAASDGSNFINAATILAEVDGTPGVNDMPGRLVFSTTADGAASPTERLRIDSSGRVGIGTASPGTTLDVAGNMFVGAKDASNAILEVGNGATGNRNAIIDLIGDTTYSDFGLRIIRANGGENAASSLTHRGTGNFTIATNEAAPITFSTTASERARIDSSGRLLVGTSTSTAYGAAGLLQILGSTNAHASIARATDNAAEPTFNLAKARGSVGTPTVVVSGDSLGRISFVGHDGTDYESIGAWIKGEVDGTPGVNDMPGRLVFSTTADGASSPTERMRIDSAGNISIGQSVTTQPGNGNTSIGLSISPSGTIFASRFDTIAALFNVNADVPLVSLRRSGLQVGTISVTTTATAYNTSSDYRLKENVTPVSDGITRLQQLKPSRFNFIADPDTVVDGFLAHEVQTIVPEAITGEKDAVDDEGNPEYQGIDQSKLVPLLTAALQEAIAKIESLEARLTAAGL
jgi:hypothetical protein